MIIYLLHELRTNSWCTSSRFYSFTREADSADISIFRREANAKNAAKDIMGDFPGRDFSTWAVNQFGQKTQDHYSFKDWPPILVVMPCEVKPFDIAPQMVTKGQWIPFLTHPELFYHVVKQDHSPTGPAMGRFVYTGEAPIPAY